MHRCEQIKKATTKKKRQLHCNVTLSKLEYLSTVTWYSFLLQIHNSLKIPATQMGN